jgi:integrase
LIYMPNNRYEKVFENLVNRINSEIRFSANVKYCEDFIHSCDAQGLSVHTKNKYLDKIRYISSIIPNKDFKQWERKDAEKVFAKLRTHATPWTVDSYVAFFKRFWRYIFGLSSADAAPVAVRWLQHSTPENGLKKEDLLTRYEINKIMQSTRNIEWKALISILCSGTRPNEVLSITLGNIHDNGETIKLYVRAKPVKGKQISTCPVYPGFFIKGKRHKEIIRQLIREHPEKADKSAKLFRGMTYSNMRIIVQRLAERTGIMKTNGKNKFIGGKKVWPYIFHHTFGTWTYAKHNSVYARRLMGHSPGSKMEAVYCHLAEEDLEDMLLGRTKNDKEENIEETENRVEMHIELGKAIMKLAEIHPDVINIEKLWEINRRT